MVKLCFMIFVSCIKYDCVARLKPLFYGQKEFHETQFWIEQVLFHKTWSMKLFPIYQQERPVDGAPSQIPTQVFDHQAPPSPTLGHDPGDRMKIPSIRFISLICENTHKVWYKNL